MRRLPVYILVDTRKKMEGRSIEVANSSIVKLIQIFRQDPYALETMHISILSFDDKLHQLFPLTELLNIEKPIITTSNIDNNNIESIFERFDEIIGQEIIESTPSKKGDWRPCLIIISNDRSVSLISQTIKYKFERIAYYDVVNEMLYEIIYRQLSSIKQLFYFTWNSKDYFLPPPPEVDIII